MTSIWKKLRDEAKKHSELLAEQIEKQFPEVMNRNTFEYYQLFAEMQFWVGKTTAYNKCIIDYENELV